MSSFLYIDGGGRIVGAKGLHSGPQDEDDAAGLFFELESLADVGMLFFRGGYPIEAPYFGWGTWLELPWLGDFIAPDEKSIRDATVEEISFVLSEVRSLSVDHEKPHQTTYESALLSANDKLTMQGLAVEMLECVDGLIARLQTRPFSYSDALLLADAYKYVSEMTIHAESILDSAAPAAEKAAKELSRIGNEARHAPGRALKEWTIAQYKAGHYASPHDASRKLRESAMAKAREFGARLSPDRAQKTIYDWLLKSKPSDDQ